MKVKTLLVWASAPVLLATMWVARKVERTMPPFEPGYHNLIAGPPLSGPHVGNCPVFPKDNIWNVPIDTLPRHPKSDAYIASIGPAAKFHMDFGSKLLSGIPIGIPYTEIPAGTPAVKVSFQYAAESDPGPYPIPNDAPIEGLAGSSGDKHILLVDPRTCMLYEIWHAVQTSPGKWSGGSGAIFNLNTNDLRKESWTSADAAGLPILPGLARYEEIEAGAIEHALRFTIPKTQAAFIWPARHEAASNKSLSLPPLGARFRLKADFDISNYSRSNRIILKALKKYGMFLADNGSAIYISGAPDKRWDDDDLHKLGAITAADLEAVDEADLQKSANSAAVDPAALKKP